MLFTPRSSNRTTVTSRIAHFNHSSSPSLMENQSISKQQIDRVKTKVKRNT